MNIMELEVDCENSTPDSLLVHKATPEYLQELLKDKKQLQSFPNTFVHLEIILEKEISRVREKLFHLNASSKKTVNELPEPNGPITTLQEKVFVPIKENPNYNFVGRLLGPRGLTAKQLEQDLECKIMVRGRGSLRDKKKEDANRGKPNWEHLEEELHVLVSVEDFESRAAAKLRRATETIRAFLEQGVRTPENEDRLKQLQLMELAVLNDKDRQQAHAQQQLQQQQQQQQQSLLLQHQQTLTTVLNSQAAAAAAAAQLMGHPTQQQQQLLARYHSSTLSPLNAASTLTGVTSNGGSGALATATGLPSSCPGVQVPTSLLYSLGGSGTGASTAGAVSSPSAGWSVPSSNGLGFSLSPQFQVAASVANLPTLSYPTVQHSVSSNLITCTPSAPTGQDPLAAITAALLTAGSGSTLNPGCLNLANGVTTGNNANSAATNQRLALAAAAAAAAASGKSTQQQQQQQQQQVIYSGSADSTDSITASNNPFSAVATVTANQLLDPSSLLEYHNVVAGTTYDLGSDSLKMRSLSSGNTSSHTRMHPYMRQ